MRSAQGGVPYHGMTEHDLVVIGGGATGLAAAVQMGRMRRTVAVIDSGRPRNAPAGHMHSYPGLDGVAPVDYLATVRAEARHYGATFTSGEAVRVSGDVHDGFVVTLADGNRIRGRRVLLATGITDLLPDIPGVRERWGNDVIHCPFCHGWEVRDQRIVVVDTHGLGGHQATLFRQLSPEVTLVVHSGDGPDEATAGGLAALGVTVVHAAVERVRQADDGRVAGVVLVDGTAVDADVVVVGAPFRPNLDSLVLAGLQLAPHPSGLGDVVTVDETCRTNLPGVLAAGNLVDPSQQVLQAAAQGARLGGLLTAELIHDDIARLQTAQRDATFWDTRYGNQPGQMWSGRVNGSFEVELTGALSTVAPGRALDVGCGEGADAIWLAQRGWDVTAVDISPTAVERAAAAAADHGVKVRFEARDLVTHPPAPGSFDMVSIQYPALRRDAGPSGVLALWDALDRGGTMLVVWHAPLDPDGEHQPGHGAFDPTRFVSSSDLLAWLREYRGHELTVDVHERRPRPNPPTNSHHVDDVVMRLRRA